MEVSEACYEGGWLKLKTSASDALRWLSDEFKPRDWDILPHVEKRSKNANAMAWGCINQIASKLQIPPIEVYRKCIDEIGGKTDIVIISKEAYEDFDRAFLSGHIGRKTEIIGEANQTYDVLVTYGSSDYNAKEMHALIESILQECRELGIPTLDDLKVQALIDDWEKQYEERV